MWLDKQAKCKPNIEEIYREYVCSRRILEELSKKENISIKTIRNYLDVYQVDFAIPTPCLFPVNMLYDATFFGMEYGFIVFSDNDKIIYFEEIKTENITVIKNGFKKLKDKGYKFKSFTIDGRRGVIQMLEKEFPNVPIQFCHFHQKSIIRRYITNNPKTECGIDIKMLMNDLKHMTEIEFTETLTEIEIKHSDFINDKNENGKWKHKRIRSAIRSLKTNLPYLFTYKNYPHLNIPNTTNKLEGIFSHLKEKVKIHRGLRNDRKKKMITFILSNS